MYRIPFQNIVGDVGFYIYQQVYPFYGAAVVLATTGFPVVISKLLAECKEKGDHESARKLLLTAIIFLQVFGLLCFFILYAGACHIAVWMHDPKLSILLKVVSFVFLLFPIVSLLRGYFQGSGDMLPTAISQVGEQSIRVLTIILFSYLFTRKGYSLYLIGGGAMFGSITGSLVSAIILFTFLLIHREWKLSSFQYKSFTTLFKGTKWIYHALVFQGLAICMSGMLMILIQLADAMNLYSLLVLSGVDQESAKSLKGIFDRGQPLIQMGTVAAASLSLSLVPLIASERLRKNTEFLYHKIKLTMQVSFVVGAGASAGLWAIIGPANTMLFENNAGSSVLGVYCLVILFSSIISTLVAIMQGLGNLLFPAIIIMLGFPIKYVLNLLLVPHYLTMGAALATIITLALISLVLSIKLKNSITQPFYSIVFFRTVILAVLLMVLFLKVFLAGTHFFHDLFAYNRLAFALQSVSAVFLGGCLYLWVVAKGNIFSEEDLSFFPFGSKLAWFLQKKDRSRENGKKN